MKIYTAHSRNFDFQKELYEPIRQSSLNSEHTFILPHEKSSERFNSKKYLKNQCDLVIAEVSYPATGLGIELGWANIYGVPIICIYKKGSKLSGSLNVVSNNFLEYSNSKEFISGIRKSINQMQVSLNL